MEIKPAVQHRDGEHWINPISGLEYTWSAALGVWVSTGKYPMGPNPMGFLGESFG